MKLFEIRIDQNWLTQDRITQLEEIFGRKIGTAPRPSDPSENASDTARSYTAGEQAKYDMGMRQISWDSTKQIVSEDDLAQFLPCTVERVIAPKLAIPATLHVEQRIEPVMNERVQVVVPGPALSTYDEVQVMDNCCTDALQTELDQGWRILAICVQPDQRRPDYVMGRVRPKE